jgi:hypothetical protein
MNENLVTAADAASEGSGVAGGSIGFTATHARGGAAGGGGCRAMTTADSPSARATLAARRAAARGAKALADRRRIFFMREC